MRILKITTGFVIQEFDTETKQWISQEFVAGDECEYEIKRNGINDAIDADEFAAKAGGKEPYLPFDMQQPSLGADRCPTCGQDVDG